MIVPLASQNVKYTKNTQNTIAAKSPPPTQQWAIKYKTKNTKYKICQTHNTKCNEDKPGSYTQQGNTINDPVHKESAINQF